VSFFYSSVRALFPVQPVDEICLSTGGSERSPLSSSRLRPPFRAVLFLPTPPPPPLAFENQGRFFPLLALIFPDRFISSCPFPSGGLYFHRRPFLLFSASPFPLVPFVHNPNTWDSLPPLRPFHHLIIAQFPFFLQLLWPFYSFFPCAGKFLGAVSPPSPSATLNSHLSWSVPVLSRPSLCHLVSCFVHIPSSSAIFLLTPHLLLFCPQRPLSIF